MVKFNEVNNWELKNLLSNVNIFFYKFIEKINTYYKRQLVNIY